MLLAAATLASALVIGGAAPASAKCVGEPNVCVLLCKVGLGNKYTAGAFQWCYIV